MRILILGGTSIAGQALLEHLREHHPNCRIDVVSRSAVTAANADRVIRGHFAELLATPSFKSELAAYDAVVHLADGVPILQTRRRRSDTLLAETLVAATGQLALAVRAARVPLFVYISSLRAIAGEHDGRVLDEGSEPRCSSLYGRTKLRLERLVAETFADSPTRAVTLRVPALYGRGGGGNFRHLMQLAFLNLPLPLGGLTNRRSILSMRNFASAVASVMTHQVSAHGVFVLHDGVPLSTAEIVSIFRDALGLPRRLFSIPGFAARLAMTTPMVNGVGRRIYGSNHVDDRRFRKAFDWTPCEETCAALSEMAQAFARTSPRKNRLFGFEKTDAPTRRPG